MSLGRSVPNVRSGFLETPRTFFDGVFLASAQTAAQSDRGPTGHITPARSVLPLHKAALAATMAATDRACGRIVAALDRLGIRDETLVIFTSDNGGARPHTVPLEGGKGELHDGGIRVPLVISWPGS